MGETEYTILARTLSWTLLKLAENLNAREKDDKQLESTPVENNKDEDEAMAEEKDAPETEEVNTSSKEVLSTKQQEAENKIRKKVSKSAAMEEDAPYDFKVDYKGKQLNAMDVGEDED